MGFFDVIFPLNIGPLTYRCPEAFTEIAKPGMIVSAPLKNKITKGVLIGKSSEIPSGAVKDIQAVHSNEPILSNSMINLLKWISEYYLAEEGLVLKNMLPKEAFIKVTQRKAKVLHHPPFLKEGWKDYILNINNINSSTVSSLIKSLNKDTYKAFLLHAPSSGYEYSFLLRILTESKNAILLIPEVSLINNLYPLLSERFGERICLFHSELSRGKRSEAIEKILSGHFDIVLGTRSAVFAPLKKVSLIAVLHEHSSSYKQENSPCYSARDVAVMRGFLEKAPVLLSSICPSIESLYNCKLGKYTLLKAADMKRPKVKVIDMRYEKLTKPYISKTVIDASARYIKNDKKIMFVVTRRGYSTLLQCLDCNYIEECPDCRIPLVFHKQDMSLKCHYCGYTLSQVPASCSRCHGYNIQLLGAGTQRVQEDLEDLLKIKTLRFDSDKAKKKLELERLIGDTFTNDNRIIIGTKLMTRRLDITGRFSMAAVLNSDLYLNLPDFRSAEKAYQEISSIIDKIEPDGEIFIQTRMPQNDLYKCLKNYDYDSFLKEELNRRKSLNYPPYSRLLLIKFISRRNLSKELLEIIKEIMRKTSPNPPLPPFSKGGEGGIFRDKRDFQAKSQNDDIEILGPYISKNNQGLNEYKLLLKSSIREKLHATARTFMEVFKDSKDVRVKIDVNPIVI